jgi:rsbT co-antagonist protein RsbR
MKQDNQVIDELLSAEQDAIVRDWLAEANSAGVAATAASNAQTLELLEVFHEGIRAGGDAAGFEQPAWEPARGVLAALSRSGAAQGGNAGDTSRFVMALKKPLFVGLQKRLGGEPARLFDALWKVSTIVDSMAQWTATTFQLSREELILRQQEELLELSTPVIKLWEGVLAVPMIGTLDSGRTQLVMESLLQRIVDTGSEMAIIDITGVPTVDTLVAQHLLKTVTAIRLMGADCIISGVRPQIAQTIVHLGIDLQGITTKATLADALALALRKGGYSVTHARA